MLVWSPESFRHLQPGSPGDACCCRRIRPEAATTAPASGTGSRQTSAVGTSGSSSSPGVVSLKSRGLRFIFLAVFAARRDQRHQCFSCIRRSSSISYTASLPVCLDRDRLFSLQPDAAGCSRLSRLAHHIHHACHGCSFRTFRTCPSRAQNAPGGGVHDQVRCVVPGVGDAEVFFNPCTREASSKQLPLSFG